MVRQLSLSEWPIGLEQDVAVLNLQPSDIQKRAGIRFERTHDGLDDFDGAVIQLGANKLLALQYYLNSPVPGTKLVLGKGSNLGLQEAVDLLNLKRSEITWVAPAAEQAMEQALQEGDQRPEAPQHPLLWRIMRIVGRRIIGKQSERLRG